MRSITPLVSALLVAALAPPAYAAPRPSSIPIPVDFQPEGVAVGDGNTFYVGSLRDGDIYRGDLRSGSGSLLVDNEPADGSVAVGMRVIRSRDWLVVAGGPTGHAYVYDTDDGSTVADTIPDKGEGPMAAFEVEEMKQILAGAIDRLGEREKIVLTLYYYEGLTLAEIGEVLGVTESRVCQIHTKAVLQLRSKITAAVREPA